MAKTVARVYTHGNLINKKINIKNALLMIDKR